MTAIEGIADPLIREGVTQAVERTLTPARSKPAYPGHFTVVADGRAFGGVTTWPGLDSWEMAGAYLLLGLKELVADYFAFVRASQSPDGNIPFAIFPGDSKPGMTESYLRGIRYPEDVYTYAPKGQGPRKWIGLFHHWQVKVNPLSVLGAISYILTAGEIYDAGAREGWLADNLDSIDVAGRYVLSRQGENGLIAGAGFYIECPPRDQYDGVTQCYAVFAMRVLARLCMAVGDGDRAAQWTVHADHLAADFRQAFWRKDHWGEYVHPTRGLVDLRPLTDVNLAAIGLGVASDDEARVIWPRLPAERSFWAGGMPTQLVSRPSKYEEWELQEPLPFVHAPGPLYDVSAMGRVWYLDALASRRMKQWDRLTESVRLVCEAGKRQGWQWHERYHAQEDGSVNPAGPLGYCEYAAVLVRVVLTNLDQFTAASGAPAEPGRPADDSLRR